MFEIWACHTHTLQAHCLAKYRYQWTVKWFAHCLNWIKSRFTEQLPGVKWQRPAHTAVIFPSASWFNGLLNCIFFFFFFYDLDELCCGACHLIKQYKETVKTVDTPSFFYVFFKVCPKFKKPPMVPPAKHPHTITSSSLWFTVGTKHSGTTSSVLPFYILKNMVVRTKNLTFGLIRSKKKISMIHCSFLVFPSKSLLLILLLK